MMEKTVQFFTKGSIIMVEQPSTSAIMSRCKMCGVDGQSTLIQKRWIFRRKIKGLPESVA